MASTQVSTPVASNPTLEAPQSTFKTSRPSTAASEPLSQSSSTVASVDDDEQGDDDDVNSEFHREAYGPEPGEKGYDEWEVRFAPDDPESPFNWSRLKRWYITILGGILVLNATFSSSAPSGIIGQMMVKFGFGREVATLTISLFVTGYCVGPLVWGPLSERYGRKIPLLIGFTIYTCFQVGCALAPNTGSILIFRFLGGTFAAAPLVVSGALISDIWDANTRGKALGFFSLAPFAGPALGPTVSGFMNVAGVEWRWVFWVMTMFAGACTVLIFLTIPETFTPYLLLKRAQKLRKETGDNRYWAPLEKRKLTFTQNLEQIVARPFKIFFREPMLIAVTVYMSFVYGCIYLLFEAYPIVFTEGHLFNTGISGLMFLPIFVGGTIGTIAHIIWWNPRYERLAVQFAPAQVPPEYRLEQAMWAAPIFAISFFWFGWTSYPNVNYWAPMTAGGTLGFATIWIFLALFNYIIDAYLFVAASALAANTVIRSLFGASFPLFATQMYETLNPRWASTLLGFLAIAMAPLPFVLRKYGPHLRRKSKYAPSKPPAPKKADEAV